MATTIEGTFTIREDLDRVIEVSDHRRDLSSTTVKVRLLRNGSETVVGSTTGADIGTAFTIDVDFDIDPGFYELEIGPDGGPIVYPQNGDRPNVYVVDTKYHS